MQNTEEFDDNNNDSLTVKFAIYIIATIAL